MKLSPTSKWNLFSIAILLLSAAWIWASANPQTSTTPGILPAPHKGFLAPDFTLQTIHGDTVTLSKLRGKAVLVNIWATWCLPCRAEMPAIQKAYDQYQERGFVVLGLNSTIQDDAAKVPEFVEQYKLNFPILLDSDGSVTSLYWVHALPTSFFIDPDGVIQEVVVGGPMSEALLHARIEKLLPEAP